MIGGHLYICYVCTYVYIYIHIRLGRVLRTLGILTSWGLVKMGRGEKEIDQELHRGLLLIFPIKMYEISEEINQELHRGLLLILRIKSV